MHALLALAFAGLLLLSRPALAQVRTCPPEERVGRIEAMVGEVRVDGAPVSPSTLPLIVCGGSIVSTGSNSRVQIYADAADSGFRLDENSSSRLHTAPGPESGLVDLLKGGLFFLSQVRRSLSVRTPYMTAGIEGTEVLVRLAADDATALDLVVYDGRVALGPAAGVAAAPASTLSTGQRLTVDRDGNSAISNLGQAGTFEALRLAASRDLAWTLYYPPIIGERTAGLPPDLVEAARLLRAGRVDEARARLARVGDGSAEAPVRDALLSIVVLTQGERETALQMARATVERWPGSVPALLALSYAEQSLANLDAARDAARRATRLPGADGLTLARLAETEMMFGDIGAARNAADRAAGLGNAPLAQTVLGFTELASYQAEAAARRFQVALSRDSEQPLAHLGLGLALIRQGQLADGRRSLEVAVTLDPTQSLLRSYLGKAFFEENRDEQAAKQLAIAKELDPTDPTPWLYDAIRKQLDNRPIAALRDLERSIALNDDRATFRSRLLLDEDWAVRTTSLGRIYQDFGFQQLGRSVAGKAVVLDPTSGAAHRLLADLSVDAPREEISRVSDLLKSKLLLPPGLNGIQPSLAFTDLNIVRNAGPARVGFNEFTSLFDSDGARLTANGVVGSDDTLGNELIANGLLGRTALSVGQYHYQTDGSRPNNDIEHDIYNIFGQVGLTADSSVQAEFARRYTDAGDRDENVFTDWGTNLRDKIQQDVMRLGGSFAVDPATTLLVSGIHANRSRDRDDDVNGIATFSTFNQTGTQLEMLLNRRLGQAGIQFGGGSYHLDQRLRSSYAFPGYVDPPVVREQDIDGSSVFTEGQMQLAPGLTGVLRLGYDWLWAPDANYSTPTPSLGAMWEPTRNVLVRAAVSRVLKRPLALNATILPTRTVGLTELFDEFDGTRSDQLAADATWQITDDVTLGVQGVARQSSAKLEGTPDMRVSDQSEQGVGFSANWLATEEIAISQSLAWRSFRQQMKDSSSPPTRYSTFSAPLDVRYFSPTGIFLGGAVSYVYQDIDQFENLVLADGGSGNAQEAKRNHLVIVDSVIGYRLPNQRGTVALVGHNLLDESTLLQSDDFRSSETGNVFLSGRTVMLQLSLTF